MSTNARTRVAAATGRAATIGLATVIVLSPLRARWVLVARPRGSIYGDYTDALLSWSDVAVLLTLLLWLIACVAARRRPSLQPRFVTIPYGCLLLVAWIGAPFAVDPAEAALTATRLTVLGALALYAISEVDDLRVVAVAAAAMVALQALVAIPQVIEQSSLGLGWLGEHTLSPSLDVSVITTADGTRVLRGYGLTDHPNILGGLLAFGVVLATAAALQRTERAGLVRVACALGTAALVLTFSRGALLALLTGGGVLAAMLLVRRERAKLQRLGLTVAAAVLVSAPVIAPYGGALLARTDVGGGSPTEARSVNERIALSEATTDIITAHPLLGVGAGNLPQAMAAASPHFAFTYQPASVVLLDIAAETGLGGAAAALLLLALPAVALLRRRSIWTDEVCITTALLAAVTVTGLADYYTWTYASGQLWLVISLGLWAGAYRRARGGGTRAA